MKPSHQQMLNKALKLFSSLKLAVVVIVVLGILSAWGTIVESKYNAEIAAKVVFHSVYMVTTLIVLVVILIAVMIDRYPWKKHHLGFILAHVGIIVLLIGSVITHRFGIDGSIALNIGETGRHIQIPKHELIVWASFDGDKWTRLFEREVDFFLKPPTNEKPIVIPVSTGSIKIVDYYPFALEERKWSESTKKDAGPALRLHWQNANVKLSQWIQLARINGPPTVRNLGPAKIVLHGGGYKPGDGNEIVLLATPGKSTLKYEVHSQRKEKKVIRGELASGQMIETGWMGLQLRALKLLPQAEEKITYIKRDRPTEITRSAIKVNFNNEDHWLGQDSQLQFFTGLAAFVVSYGGRRLEMGFDMKLLEFHMQRYQGTRQAATYESDVMVPELGKVNISMNEPLKYKGYTFYQSSFREDEETGKPMMSVLSVNRDPGRWLKYLGSLIIVLGIIVMFYFRKMLFTKGKVL